MLVAPPANRRAVYDQRSERVAAPPSLSTVSSLSVPPLEMKVPPPVAPGRMRAPVITQHVASNGVGSADRWCPNW